jgi:hypothetical protein
MPLDYSLNQREAQPGAVGVRGEKRCEHLILLLSRYPTSVIRDAETDKIPLSFQRGRQVSFLGSIHNRGDFLATSIQPMQCVRKYFIEAFGHSRRIGHHFGLVALV